MYLFLKHCVRPNIILSLSLSLCPQAKVCVERYAFKEVLEVNGLRCLIDVRRRSPSGEGLFPRV